jgi:DNA modification methylase
MIAAERTGRRAVLLEIDPAYADVIVRRWQETTGEVAVLEGDDRIIGPPQISSGS